MPVSGGIWEEGAVMPRGSGKICCWKIGLAFAKPLREESGLTQVTSQHPIPCVYRLEGNLRPRLRTLVSPTRGALVWGTYLASGPELEVGYCKGGGEGAALSVCPFGGASVQVCSRTCVCKVGALGKISPEGRLGHTMNGLNQPSQGFCFYFKL